MSGGTQVTTQSTAPWKGQQKYLLRGWETVKNRFDGILDYYQGETVAGFDPAEQAAQQGAL